MTPEFSAERVALEVLDHLERRRPAIVADEQTVTAEVRSALEPVARAYRESELPASYFEALEHEVVAAVPARWLSLASAFTDLERRQFGLWRGGDPVARITYVFSGLVVGGLCVWAPFIPIWEKWFPFALAIAAFWLPTVQVAWQRRRYARALGGIARQVGSAQRQLERSVTLDDLALPGGT